MTLIDPFGKQNGVEWFWFVNTKLVLNSTLFSTIINYYINKAKINGIIKALDGGCYKRK